MTTSYPGQPVRTAYDNAAQQIIADFGLSANPTTVLSTDGQTVALEFDVEHPEAAAGQSLWLQPVFPPVVAIVLRPSRVEIDPGNGTAVARFELTAGARQALANEGLLDSPVDFVPIVTAAA